MTTANVPNWLPSSLLEALVAIRDGAQAKDLETQVLDFKEDPATRGRSGNPDAEVVAMLLDETVCLANGDGGEAHIVLGVADRASGADAFTGTKRDPQWIEQKIAGGTKPSLRVEAERMTFAGATLIVIRIPRQYTVFTRTKGGATYRVGTGCLPLTDEVRRRLIAERANPDYTAGPSELTIDDLDPAALAEARRLLRVKRDIKGSVDEVPDTPLRLLSSLGLLTRDERLTVAAALLFAPLSAGRVAVRHLIRTVPGGAPTASDLSGPLVLTLPELSVAVTRNARTEIDRISFDDGQEVAIPTFPAAAVDEVISNALVHRDWGMLRPVVVDQSPVTLVVTSPGGLPFGVISERLLTTPSIPRNNLLMAGMRQLGLVEESSRGFDRMWVSMLSSGRRPPTVVATDMDLEVVLSAARPDHGFIRALRGVGKDFDAALLESAFVLVVLRHLFDHPMMTLRQVESTAQMTETEAIDAMEWLVAVGVLEQIRNAREWVLSSRTRRSMGLNEVSTAAISIQEWIEQKLLAGESVNARQLADEAGVERQEVSDILAHLRTLGRAIIDPEGPSRGPSVRWCQA